MKPRPSSPGKKLRAAVIGCGRMGAFTSDAVRAHAPDCWFPLSHIEALKADDNIAIIAIADGNDENLKKAQNFYEIENAYKDPLELLKFNDIDILCIATRTLGRADLIMEAYEAGVRALHVEKPLCNSTIELHALAKIFADPNFFITYGAIRRLMPPYQKAKELLSSGEIGALTSITIEHGRSMLLWSHPHSLDLCLYFADKKPLKSVSAIFDDINVDASGHIITNDPVLIASTLEFDEKLVAYIGQTPGMNTRLLGENGEIIVGGDGLSLQLKKVDPDDPYRFSWNPISFPTGSQVSGTGAAISLLVNCLEGHKEAIYENREVKSAILDGQRAIFRMAESGLTEKSVNLADIGFGELTVQGQYNGFFA